MQTNMLRKEMETYEGQSQRSKKTTFVFIGLKNSSLFSLQIQLEYPTLF